MTSVARSDERRLVPTDMFSHRPLVVDGGAGFGRHGASQRIHRKAARQAPSTWIHAAILVAARPPTQTMVTGSPGLMRAASQLIERLARRTQPWDTAVPSVPPTLVSPCRAIWPGPPSNSWKTFERALVARANGAPGAVPGQPHVLLDEELAGGRGRRRLADDRLVGAQLLRRCDRRSTDRAPRLTTRCQSVADMLVFAALIQPDAGASYP